MTRPAATAQLARHAEQAVLERTQLCEVADSIEGVCGVPPCLLEPPTVAPRRSQPAGMQGVAQAGGAKPALGGVEGFSVALGAQQEAAKLDGGVVDGGDHLLDVAAV